MKKIALITLLLLSTVLLAEGKKIKMPKISFAMVEDKNFGVMQRNCQWCHSYGYIINQGKQNKAFWIKVVEKMRDTYKAPITKHDEVLAVEYLTKHFGTGK